MIDLNPNHLGTVKAILAEHVPECEVRAFGSRATWTAKDYSDLDLAILGKGPLDWTTLGRLKEAFEESDLPMRVDVLDWHTISGGFREVIEREHLVLVAAASKPLDQQNSGMGAEWRELCWGDLATLEYGRALRGHNSRTGPIRVFGTNGPIGWHDEALCSYPSVVVGRKGAYRGVHYSANPFFVIDTAFYLKPKVELDTRWAYYQLLTQDINGLDSGSAIPSTRREDFYNLPVQVPPLSEQRTIAQILGTLDDKIELNRQLNETLEELVRAIFKDWFVDFGPVRAKLEGHDTGLPEHLAELFPDRLVESELGGIPEGWEVKPVTALVSIVGGGTPKTSVNEYWGGDIPWFSVVDTPPPGSVYVVMTEKTITQKGLQESSARLVPAGTTIISARGTVGNLAMCGRPMAFNQSCYGLRTSSDVGDYFVFLTAHSLVDRLQAMAHGSVFSTITRQTIEAVSVAVAPRAVYRAFEATVQPFFSRIKVNVEESRILSQVRDVLLPKLVSGEMRVDVETP